MVMRQKRPCHRYHDIFYSEGCVHVSVPIKRIEPKAEEKVCYFDSAGKFWDANANLFCV